MKGTVIACPSCGTSITFRISSSLVAVCEFCQTVVARADRNLEDRGKIAAIVDTNSPLRLGLRGKFGGKSFEIVGRTQYQHAAGGRWDEWYAAFSNGKWGWLAEAQGRFYLTRERDAPTGQTLPGSTSSSWEKPFPASRNSTGWWPKRGWPPQPPRRVKSHFCWNQASHIDTPTCMDRIAGLQLWTTVKNHQPPMSAGK